MKIILYTLIYLASYILSKDLLCDDKSSRDIKMVLIIKLRDRMQQYVYILMKDLIEWLMRLRSMNTLLLV